MLIDGNTELIAHLGFPTHSFKAPMIYNPYFESIGVNAVVVPMGCRARCVRGGAARRLQAGEHPRRPDHDAAQGERSSDLLDEASRAVRVAGACNAVRRTADGRLAGDMFDGEGFVRGVLRKGLVLAGARALVVGCGGVGSAIAASLAEAGAGAIALFDVDADSAQSLAQRLRTHYPEVVVTTGSNDPLGVDLVVNATPLGMNAGDPLPIDMSRLAPSTFVGEVVMKTEMTAFLAQAQARGCRIQVGTDMLFEMIPPYLEFFGFPTATPEQLRSVARVKY